MLRGAVANSKGSSICQSFIINLRTNASWQKFDFLPEEGINWAFIIIYFRDSYRQIF